MAVMSKKVKKRNFNAIMFMYHVGVENLCNNKSFKMVYLVNKKVENIYL